MINDDIFEDIIRYEVGRISEHAGRETILATNNLKAANELYESLVNNIELNSKYHVQIFIFDYDKNCNLNYYDSATDNV